MLAAAGLRVLVVPGSPCCGLTWITTGQLGIARRVLRRTLDVLAPAVAAGLPIVGLEPSCTAALRGDLPELLAADPRAAPGRRRRRHARRRAGAVRPGLDAARPARRSRSSRRCTAISTPCSASPPNAACSTASAWTTPSWTRGAAASPAVFGFEREHHDVSVAVAERGLLPALRAAEAGRYRPGGRVQLPHPDRPPDGASGRFIWRSCCGPRSHRTGRGSERARRLGRAAPPPGRPATSLRPRVRGLRARVRVASAAGRGHARGRRAGRRDGHAPFSAGARLGPRPAGAGLGPRCAGAGLGPRLPAVADARRAAVAALGVLLGEGLATAAVEVTTPGGRPLLPGLRLTRVAAEARALDAPGLARLRGVLDGAPPVFAAYLFGTLATGRGIDLVESLADAVAGHKRDANWLHRHLGVLDGAPGPATFDDDDGSKLRLRQFSPVMSGPTVADPAAGARGPGVRAVADHRRARRRGPAARRPAVRAPLSDAAGPRPRSDLEARARPGAVAPFPRHAAVGARPLRQPLHRPRRRAVRLAGRGATASASPTLVAAVLDALEAGVPVPIYLGRAGERHVVLAFGRVPDGPGERLRLYDPARGEVLDVDVAGILAGTGVVGLGAARGRPRPSAPVALTVTPAPRASDHRPAIAGRRSDARFGVGRTDQSELGVRRPFAGRCTDARGAGSG